MADEEQTPIPEDRPAGDPADPDEQTPDEQADTAAESDDEFATPDDPAGEGGDDLDDPPVSWSSSVDPFELGTVTLHHPSRDVRLFMDWGAARRLLKAYELRRTTGLEDVLSLSTSQPTSGWIVTDLEEFVAVSWLPGLPSKPSRMVIDPVVSDTA